MAKSVSCTQYTTGKFMKPAFGLNVIFVASHSCTIRPKVSKVRKPGSR